ncbi:MAG TPA: glycosyltransferase family 39 protein [Anaerolineae bacterium]|jgi:hypothetical protein|nr:glycosyltransferase family 39 protein [Anaerolineae bacterium]
MASTSQDNVGNYLGRWLSRWPTLPLWPFFILGGLLFLGWAWLSNWWTPITAVDISQLRANTLLPAPNLTSQIRQDFVAQKNGLYQVELLFSGQDGNEGNARLEIQLLEASGRPIAFRSLDGSTLSDQQPITLSFEPQAASAGQRFTLQVSGTAGNKASLWGYDLDSYEDGQLALVGSQTAAQDLRFVSRYQLTARTAVSELGRMVSAHSRTIALALALLFMPGCLLMQAGRFLPGKVDPFAWWGAALALGASIWPVAWLWLSTVGGRWASWSLWLALIAGWAAVLILFLIQRRKSSQEATVSRRAVRLSWHHGALLFVLALGLAGRLLAVRDLAFPPWVDSSRHALITTLMADSGQIISTYQPLLPVEEFPYHFGFHTLSAGLTMLDGQSLQGLLLILGQLLNGLVPLTVYAAAYLLTRKRSVGLLAALLVALPFFFPAYYATWGRMTQLTAVMALPLALAFTWLLIRGARNWRRAWPLVGLLAAGLFLIHFRVFLLYLPFAALVWLGSRGRQGRWLALAAALAMILSAPHLASLAGYARPAAITFTIPGYNDFPVGYITVGLERAILWAAAAAGLLVIIAALRRRRWVWLPVVIMSWMLLVAGLLATDRLGLPGTTLINLNSAYIVAFVPLALLLAIVASHLWRWLSGRFRLLDNLLALAAGAGLTAILLFGLRQQVTILNAVTILARAPDAPGLAWLDDNLPQEATVAVNSWLWLGSTWAGSDGGAWIVPLTERASTTPPADYIYDRDLARQVNRFNEEASERSDWSDPAAAQWLKEQGVSHIFVGAKGGRFEPADLAKNPRMRQLFGRDGVFIFEIQ